MSKIPFVLYKDRDGWMARSRIELEPHGLEAGRVLDLQTYKSPRGGLWTYAQCGTVKGHAFTFIVFQDFSKPIQQNPKARCTEKAVQTMHQAALDAIEPTLAEVVSRYTKTEGHA